VSTEHYIYIGQAFCASNISWPYRRGERASSQSDADPYRTPPVAGVYGDLFGSQGTATMTGAYTHLDISEPDPIADFQLRMASAGVDRALAVETWSGDNFQCLERIVTSSVPEFRCVP